MSDSTALPLLPAVEQLGRPLRLPHLRRSAPDALETARAQRWDPAEALRVLRAEEAAGRDKAGQEQRRQQAGFPTGKTLAVWNEPASAIPLPTQRALRTLEWVRRRENVVLCGPSGTGKSHFPEGLGQVAIAQGLHVAWFAPDDLGALVRRHRVDDSVSRSIERIVRADLVCVDDIGLLPVGPDAAEGFFRLVDTADERRSIGVSSNLHPSGFDQLMPKTLATATVDRLLHHARVVVKEGEGFRLAEATRGKGVMPLPP
jgi:DNA replication protein DnaC